MATSTIKTNGPVTLYTGSEFKTNVPLSMSITNFKRLKIFLNYSYQEVYNNNRSSFQLNTLQGAVTTHGYFTGIRIAPSSDGMSLVCDRNNMLTVYASSNNPIVAVQNDVYITRVEGYYY